ncbi:MAG: hypothetical protein QF416_02595 [Candidatus Marinimicrobia bacterium]|nr:hypothetical protein [Candidatus Neomarinimicrobiota bacterium]
MFLLNLILAVFLLTGIGYALYLIKKNRALSEINSVIARELSVLIESTAEVVKKQRAGKPPGHHMAPDDMLKDPALLATLLTAMVNKYGDMKIGMPDFDSIGLEDYVSVYVDTVSNELILSLDPDLAPKGGGPESFGFYPKTDDGTFH